MLTREGFVVADMSAPTPLQRSSWKAEAIRKGNLKISGPIPITEDVPLNDEEEKQFAETGGLDSLLQPQDALEEQSRPETPAQPLQPTPGVPMQSSALRSNPIEVQPQPQPQPQQQETVSPRQSSKSPPRMRQVVDEVQRQSVVQPSPYTSPTPLRSTPESNSKAAQKKKQRGSGLKGVIRKMFGRKSRDGADDQDEDTVRRGHNYHQSDPGLLRQSPPREQNTPSAQRISTFPVEELRPLHPLGQHLPFPMNVNAPQSSQPQNYLTFDMQRPDVGRRRASLPNNPSTSTHRHSLDESRGRLSTWEERVEEDGAPSPGIGIALSSPTQATPTRSKRRSRSADALFELVKGQEPMDRRRSAEIRHWRESYVSGSAYSRPQTAKTVETIRSVQTQEPTIRAQESESFQEMSATLVHEDDPETPGVEDLKVEPEREVQAPVSVFNFGNLQNERLVEERVLDVPLEAPPPPVRNQNRLSIEERVQHLESAYENLEGSLRRISTRNNRQTIILENAPKNLRTRNRSSSARSASGSRSRSTTSIHQEPIHQSSSDTLNPGLPSPVLAAGYDVDGDDSSKHTMKTLHSALKHERSARKALEKQVCTLQHDVTDLHALITKLIHSATTTSLSYPTPSPDTLVMTTEDRLLTPRADMHDRKLDFGRGGDVRESVLSKFSHSENGSESDFEDRSFNSYDEVATPDVWATPKEEGFGASGFFHGDSRTRAYA